MVNRSPYSPIFGSAVLLALLLLLATCASASSDARLSIRCNPIDKPACIRVA